MRFYKMSRTGLDHAGKWNDFGSKYFATRDAADKALKKWKADGEDAGGEVTTVGCAPNSKSVLSLLNRCAT